MYTWLLARLCWSAILRGLKMQQKTKRHVFIVTEKRLVFLLSFFYPPSTKTCTLILIHEHACSAHSVPDAFTALLPPGSMELWYHGMYVERIRRGHIQYLTQRWPHVDPPALHFKCRTHWSWAAPSNVQFHLPPWVVGGVSWTGGVWEAERLKQNTRRTGFWPIRTWRRTGSESHWGLAEGELDLRWDRYRERGKRPGRLRVVPFKISPNELRRWMACATQWQSDVNVYVKLKTQQKSVKSLFSS